MLSPPAKCVLVIDDENHLCVVIQACLEHLGGWNVLIAESGQEGLHKAQANQPDAILLDVIMPDIDGLMLSKKLQENPLTQAIPIILLTAKLQASDHSQFDRLGVAGVIAKPFDPLTLTAQISDILGW
jgi:CheY-like chemotaxis protein